MKVFRSPVSDDGRGLKRRRNMGNNRNRCRSPVSDDGRGLKRECQARQVLRALVRPSVMTGVD